MVEIMPQLLTAALAPAALLYIHDRGYTPSWLGPVVLSYVLGIVLASTDIIALDDDWSKHVSEGSIMLAIPLLLFTTDIKGWLRHARSTVTSFALCVVSAAVVTCAGTSLFRGQLPDIWKAAGMIAGVNTGGTPNMQAVGIAVGAGDSLFVQLNAADILYGGIYLIFLTSIAKVVLGKYYPAYEYPLGDKGDTSSLESAAGPLDVVKAIVLAIAVVVAAIAPVYLLTGSVTHVALIILAITSWSVGLSFIDKVRFMPGSFDTGNYLLLIFCVAIGMRSEASQILGNSGVILQYYGVVYVCTILMHFGLAYLFKIDRDTLMITSTASIFGPAFVGQIAQVLGNRSIVFGGIATGLVGYAVGNYLGIAVAYLMR